jgi:hypothetical protein
MFKRNRRTDPAHILSTVYVLYCTHVVSLECDSRVMKFYSVAKLRQHFAS